MSDLQPDTVVDWPALSAKPTATKPRASSAWQSREHSLSKLVKPVASPVCGPVSTPTSLAEPTPAVEVPTITISAAAAAAGAVQQPAPRQPSHDSVSLSSLCVSDATSSEVSSTRQSPRAQWTELNKSTDQSVPLSLASVANTPELSIVPPACDTPTSTSSPTAADSNPASRPRSLSATAPAFVVAPKSDTSSVSGSSGDRLSTTSESPRFRPHYGQQPVVYVMPPVVDPQYAQMLMLQQQQQQMLILQEQQRSLAAVLAMQKSINEATKRQIKTEAERAGGKDKGMNKDSVADGQVHTSTPDQSNEAPVPLKRTPSLNSSRPVQPRLQRSRSLDESRHIHYLQSVVHQQKQMPASVVYMPALQPASGNVPLSFVTPAGTTIYSQPAKLE